MASTTTNLFSDNPVPPAVRREVSMLYQRDVPLPMRDGTLLRANLYRPAGDEPVPVLMTFGPYGKDIPLALRHPENYRALAGAGGGVFLNWETPDPEHWVPRGYAVLRVDSRGTGASPGTLDPVSAQQARDFYDAIEWAGTQPWSTGKVGLLGISYYAMSQWAVAALRPPHLTAMMPWEGASDLYRDFARHGGILNTDFVRMWAAGNARTQHRGTPSQPLDEDTLAQRRVDTYLKAKTHPLDDDAYTQWLPDLSTIEVPFVSVGNWGNLLLHLRGNTEAYTRASSTDKWLRIITGDHILPFYAPEALALQEAFFGHYLKGDDTGWQHQPPVRVAVRHPDHVRWHDDTTWPLTGTQWTDFHLDATTHTLSHTPPATDATTTFEAPGGTVTFTLHHTLPATQITGPVALRLWASATSSDMDLFVTLRHLRADGTEHHGINPTGKPAPMAQGWLRASHRHTDPTRSLPYRPWHTHDRELLLDPDDIVPLDIEIWPTSLVLEPGDRLLLDISSSDNERAHFRADTDPDDRPAHRFDGTYTLHTGGPHHASYLRLPVIPNHTL
ncbi:CocE/NonD family hydrolase [Streptomyces sp. URMC 126]|uniref:CocE/NonD family hydrolase n=1 Tax=Streptomyces sp. URMC 126 TaxID=3423401 RepID=UPI003F1A7B30